MSEGIEKRVVQESTSGVRVCLFVSPPLTDFHGFTRIAIHSLADYSAGGIDLLIYHSQLTTPLHRLMVPFSKKPQAPAKTILRSRTSTSLMMTYSRLSSSRKPTPSMRFAK